jgi:hypothetical protein
MSHKAIIQEIEQLDPVTDHQRIVVLTACYEFPFDTTRSLEYALFRTFAVAKGTKLLASTGEFTERPQKRYDDTVLILSEILENGYDSERGRSALRKMNRMHNHYTIPNDEFLYTLSTFIYEPIRWNGRFGWRPLLEKEKLASFNYWVQVGRRMGIKELPTDYHDFERFNIEYEQAHFRFSEDNARIVQATQDMFLSWFLPRALWGLGRPFLAAIMDDHMLQAIGLPKPAPWKKRLVNTTLKLRARLLRLLPSRRVPFYFTKKKYRTYPNGYEIEELGAF